MESRYESIQQAIRAAAEEGSGSGSEGGSGGAAEEQRRVEAEISRAGAVLSPKGAAMDLSMRLSRSVAELGRLLELVPGSGGGGK
jgi:hypothetical protein